MGQAVKYATLGVAIVVIVGLIVALVGELLNSGPLNEYSRALASALGNSTLLGAIQNVRGAINYVTGSPSIVTACLWILIVLPFLKIPIAITLSLIHI